ncbi:uncharacterized protein LOC122377501 isoform X2 [Amphibalanus amphitrite]|uniref:uncharacterized protein LOC122377501 isoform X2 n=1 Tax=Amphibalanus amphitrite TaxID=1232801 RepID=UPI001C90D797|nr:uncharacterized protein LOC122377501 isoform X2 [Amphibalanus amphitrite]
MDLDKLSKEELVSELSRRGEDVRGRKPVLLERLREILKEEQYQSQGAMSQAKEEKDNLQEEHEPKKVDDDKGVETQSGFEGGDATSDRPASSVRTAASMASARAMERAKLAGLSAKRQALKKKHLLEAQEAELRRMREEVELQAEIEECEAREKVFEEMMTEAQMEQMMLQPLETSSHPLEKEPKAVLQLQEVATKPQVTVQTGLKEVAAKPQVTVKTGQKEVATKPQVTVQAGQKEVVAKLMEVTVPKLQGAAAQRQEKKSNAASLLQEVAERPQDAAQARTASHKQEVIARSQESAYSHEATEPMRHDIRMARRLQLPALDLTVFKGDSSKYKPFLKAFEANIASNVDSEAEKLLYLLKFTQGKPHDIVQTCVHLPEERGYLQAVELLNSRYDTGVYAVTSLITQMQNLPALRADDAEALDDLSIFLRGCLNALETQPHGLRSVDPKTICKLLEKLPHHMIEKWRRLVDDIEHVERRQANFRDLVGYIEKEARIAMNPSYGRQVLGSSGRPRLHEARKTEPRAVRKTAVGKTLAGSIQSVGNPMKCYFCEGMHKTESCKKLQQKTPEERTTFVKQNGLCFACLQHGHRSRFCKERRNCEKCGRSHPTVLHIDKPESPTVTSGHLAPSRTGGGKLQVLKVQVCFGDLKVTTNAFLDSGSTHSFISSHLLDELGLKQQKRTSLKVSTISGEQTMNSSIIPGLLIEDLDQGNVMELPPLYVLSRIPVVTDDVPSQEDMQRWTYLQEAGVTLRTMDAGEEVGLLIGGNAGGVMEPLQVCPSQHGGPHAILTRFGWILGGLKNERGRCQVNRIKVDMNDQMSEEWFENRAETRKGLSIEDLRWCNQMENGCIKKEKYEITLPFRDQTPPLENNRSVAEGRLEELKEMCALGGFKLTKFNSNSVKVLQSVPQPERSKQVKDLVLGSDPLPTERALGVVWDPNTDTIGFSVDMKKLNQKPATRRGYLSAAASCYDPLGLVAPCVVRARMVVQKLHRLGGSWDEEVPESLRREWEEWLRDLSHLSLLKIPRCLSPLGLDAALAAGDKIQLHLFADASTSAYGVVTYVCCVDEETDHASCRILFSRARLAPMRQLSVPRLELAAATLAVRSSVDLRRALDVDVDVHFWTDSTTVLKYIRNEKTRFPVFVANRLSVIHDGSTVEQWHYVPSELNPADLVSRGMKASSLINSDLWKFGPSFLKEAQWPVNPDDEECVHDADQEDVRVAAMKTGEESSPMEKLTRHYSSWRRLVRAVALLRRLVRRWKNATRGATLKACLTVAELKAAESAIIRDIQARHFSEELCDLKTGKPVRKSSKLARLDPWLDGDMIRVGGRLSQSALPFDSKHPKILPKRDPAVDLIVTAAHEQAGHEGRQHVLSDLRASYWILGANAAVRRCLSRCVSCKKRLKQPEHQKMADLPEERTEVGGKAFAHTGVDYFGPFFVKHGRSQVKKYGVVFTCLTIRAVHLEVADSLSTDSFLCALRRFVARRGGVQSLRSDQGTNFIGAEKELKEELKKLKERDGEIREAALHLGIDWRFHPPHASHFGGVWERQIRTIRKILTSLLTQQTFSHETLQTMLCEVEAIINNRPLTPFSTDAFDQPPLTPNHLLLLRSVVFPPSSAEWDHRRSWKQAGYLAEQFWRRWRTEYLPLLQERGGRTTRSRVNIKKGDIVLMVDDTVPRGVWPLGRIEDAFTSADGRVRSVRIRARGSFYVRPVTKVVKIV